MAEEQLLVVAGEVSGDQHGARLYTALERSIPDLQGFGLGGSALSEAGLELTARSSDIAVVGLVEALRVLPRARTIFRELLAEVDRRRPSTAVLIDSPDFNLRLARELKKRGVRVVYYVSPQVWAWRSGRVKTIAKYVDRMLVLFGFEEEWYRQRGVKAVHVGHPLVDEIPVMPQAWDDITTTPDILRVALLPGSRPSEVQALLPLMLDAANELSDRFPIELQLIRAPDLDESLFAPALEANPLPVQVVREGRLHEIAAAHLALCASGTATLEVGLLRTPMVVVYRVKRWSHWIGKMVIEVPNISLVNLVSGSTVVPELVQDQATPSRVAATAEGLLGSAAARDAMREKLALLRVELGEPGATERAATEVLEVMASGESVS